MGGEPPIFCIFEDYELIYREYSKYYDFHYDFKNISFLEFNLRIYGLDGLSEIFSLRDRVIFGGKIEKHERKYIDKMLNETQKKWRQEDLNNSNLKRGHAIISSFGDKMRENSLKNKQK